MGSTRRKTVDREVAVSAEASRRRDRRRWRVLAAAVAVGSIGSGLVAPVSAATLFWDGGTTDIVGNGNGFSGGTAGTWNTTTLNWDAGNAVPYAAWNNSTPDSAVFGGTAGTVSLGTNVTVAGIVFNTTAYTVGNSTNTLSFAGTSSILFNGVAAAAISGPVGGTGNVVLSTSSPATAGTLTLSPSTVATGGGWSGTTTINSSMTLALGSNASFAVNALANSTGITINGGTLSLTRNAGGNAQDQVSNSAGISFNAGGTFSQTNGIGGSFTETVGAVTVGSGQANFLFTNGSSSGGVITTLGGLSRTASTAAVTFNNANAAQTSFRVTGAANTAAGQIIGPWATFGTAVATQTDYAIYTGGNGTVAAANIAATAETTWTNAANAYTLSIPAVTAAGTSTALTATRNITALRASSTVTNLTSGTTASSPTFTLTGHTLAVGDPVVLGGTAPGGFSTGVVYYVASVGAGTFTLAATPGGTAINATSVQTPNVTSALKLDAGFNLGTTGILNSGTAPIGIGRSATGGQVTLPAAGAGNLFLTAGSGTISIDAPIVDNGGALTVVKNGSGNLFLTGANTYTGGTVLNAGTLATTADSQFGTGGGLTVHGAATWNTGAAVVLTYNRAVAVNDGAVLSLASGNALKTITGALTGSGSIINTATTTFEFNNTGNTFTGTLNTGYEMRFNSLGDSSSPINIGGATAGFTWQGGAKTFALRPFTIQSASTGIINNNGTGTLTIQSNLAISGAAGARTFGLGGTNTGANVFAGNIADAPGSVVSLTKSGVGTWVLSGTNTYSGVTTLSPSNPAGTLVFSGIQSLSPNTTIAASQSSSSSHSIRFLDDGAGTISFNRPISFGGSNTSQVFGIFVGNNNTANLGTTAGTTIGSTIVSGDITHTSTAADTATFSINVTGANNYRLQTGTITLNNLVTRTAGQTTVTVLNPTTANMTVPAITMASGNTGIANDGVPVLRFDGTSTDNRVTGVISDAADVLTGQALSVQKQNTSTWILQGNNTYSGSTTVTAGNLNIQHANALGVTSSGTTVANGAQLQLEGGISFAAEPLALTPGTGGSAMLRNLTGANTWNGAITANTATSTNVSRVQIEAGSSLTLAGAISLTGSAHQFVLQGDGNVVISGQVTGVGRVTSSATGTGVRTLSNDTNSFTGSVSANGGTIAFTSIADVGATGSALGAPALADATIQLGSAAVAGGLRYVGTDPSGHTSNRVINLAGTTGSATIEASGVGPLTLTSALTATGGGSKTLTLAGTNTGSNTIAGAIVNNSGTNTTSVNKTGTGKWILSGSSTYTGPTTVSAGTLLINGSISSNVTLPSAAAAATTLGGSGMISGAVAIDAGRLAPGNSPGVLTVTGTVSLGTATTSATYAVELGGTTPGNTSSNYDQLITSGATTITSASLDVALVNGFVPSSGDVFYIAARGDAGAHGSFFAGLAEGGTYTFTDGATALITYQANWTGTQAGSSLSGGNDIALYGYAAPIPEPGSAGLLAMAGIGLLAARRRRRM